MDTENAIRLAMDPGASLTQLTELIGIDETVDRIVAKHQNATPELLLKLTDNYDEETLGNVLQNPNVPIDLVQDYGSGYPTKILKNSAFLRLLQEYPELFDEIPRLLEFAECPEIFVRKYALDGSRLQQLMVLRNPVIPEEIRRELTPDYFFNDAFSNLNQLINEQSKSELKKYLEEYKNTSVLYSMPKFLPLDFLNPLHRFDDQVLKGFPFTSTSWPWPVNSSGRFLQPIAQINLERASALLELELGSGLLQVWLDEFTPTIRIVPISSFNETLDDFYPDDAPWTEEDNYECVILQNSEKLPYPRLEWIPMGRMFPEPEYTYGNLWNDELQISPRSMEKLGEALNQKSLPVNMHKYFGTNRFFSPFLRLGGYQQGSGNEADLSDWPQWPIVANESDKRVLLYVASDDIFCLVVTYAKNKHGEVVFDARISTDR